MALSLVYTVPAVLLTIAVFHYLSSWNRQRQFAKFAAAHGAELPVHAPPGKLPWGIGNILRVLRSEKTGEDILDDILVPAFKAVGSTTYGSTALFGEENINTIDPLNVQTILATNFKDWETGKRRAAQLSVVLGRSISTTDGEEWAHARGILRPQFNRDNINDLEYTEKASRILIDTLPVGAEDGWTAEVDLQPVVSRFTLDTATKFLFGESVNSQLAAAGRLTGDEKGEAALFAADASTNEMSFADAFELASEFMGKRFVFQAFYWLCNSKRYHKAVDRVREVANYYVNKALASHPPGSADRKSSNRTADLEAKKKYSLLESLVEDTRDPVALRDQVIVMLVAGRDTTAHLLSWLFLFLALRPRVLKKLREQILADFGSHPGPNAPVLNLSTLKSCRYLQYVINETLRVYPPVPINVRQAARDTILPTGGGPDGTKPMPVMKGQFVTFVPYAIQRRKDLWGPDADEFRPERWEGRKFDWSYIPFSGGPRICIGQQYALTEASYLIVRLLQAFDAIEWCGPQEYLDGRMRFEKTFGVTMSPRHGAKVRLRRAKS